MENKKENKNGRITLEKLAGMVASGLGQTDKRFDSLDTEFYDVKSRLGKVEYQVDEVHDILKRFEENDILNLQKRVQILEKAVRALATSSTSK